MLSPTAITNTVMDGRVPGGYKGKAAAQSSLNKGSSSEKEEVEEMGRGMRVFRRARWVVNERRGRGYVAGGDRRRIYRYSLPGARGRRGGSG